MLSKNAIEFSEGDSQISSFGSNDSVLNQEGDDDDKSIKLSIFNPKGQGHHRGGDDDTLSHTNDNFNDLDPKASGRRKGGNQKDTGLRAFNKARKNKILPNKKKEQGLSKERVFLYKPFIPMPDLSEYVNTNIEIRIAMEYISPYNPALIRRLVWGNESYTSNSDAVCILKHTGLIDFNNIPEKKYVGLSLHCLVGRCNTRRNYTAFLKNGYKSRKTNGYMGFSLKPQSIQWLTNLGDVEELSFYAARMCNVLPQKRVKTAPINVKKFPPIPEQTIVFNMCNEPSTKYSLISISDKSSEHEEFTSFFLKSKVLYLETDDSRFEIAKNEDSLFEMYDKYKFSKVNNPTAVDNDFMERNPIPLSDQYLEVLYKDLDWQEIKWGVDYIMIREKSFKGIVNFKLYDIKKDNKKQDANNAE